MDALFNGGSGVI